jgi:peptidyl-prolyl cis-trans isomerase-like 4
LIHNIQQNYIAQTGDPTGSGRGGESIFSFSYGDQAQYFEMEKFPIIKHRKKGTVSMINNSNDMHGSQVISFIIKKFLILLNSN